MSTGKYSPIRPHANQDYDFCFNTYGQTVAPYNKNSYDAKPCLVITMMRVLTGMVILLLILMATMLATASIAMDTRSLII